jgi:pyrroloquinoline-quinone synthase
MMNIGPTPFLEPLLKELESHPVNTNAFFQAFKDRWLSRDQLHAFLRQYHYFCKHFVKELEGLLYHTPVDEVELRVELIKTLHSELGDGHGEHAHIRLLERFTQASGLSKSDLDGTIPIPEVEAYLSVLHRLFTESNYLAALGAELAVETTAAAEFRYFYPGLTKYEDFRASDLAFFQLHLEAEECHSQWLAEAVRKTAVTQTDLDEVATGARATADAWQMFWEGMYREVFDKTLTGVPG